MLRIRLSEHTAIEEPEDDNDNRETEQNSIGFAHGDLEAMDHFAEVREEMQYTEETQHP